MRRLLIQLAMVAALCAPAPGVRAQIVGLQPTPIGMYTWNQSTGQWQVVTSASTYEPLSNPPQAFAFYSYNTTLGQWVPCTSLNACFGGGTVGTGTTPEIPYYTGANTIAGDPYLKDNAAIGTGDDQLDYTGIAGVNFHGQNGAWYQFYADGTPSTTTDVAQMIVGPGGAQQEIATLFGGSDVSGCGNEDTNAIVLCANATIEHWSGASGGNVDILTYGDALESSNINLITQTYNNFLNGNITLQTNVDASGTDKTGAINLYADSGVGMVDVTGSTYGMIDKGWLAQGASSSNADAGMLSGYIGSTTHEGLWVNTYPYSGTGGGFTWQQWNGTSRSTVGTLSATGSFTVPGALQSNSIINNTGTALSITTNDGLTIGDTSATPLTIEENSSNGSALIGAYQGANLALYGSGAAYYARLSSPKGLWATGGLEASTAYSGGFAMVAAANPADTTGLANGVMLTVPSSVTTYSLEMPGAQPGGIDTYLSCSPANPSVCSWGAPSGYVNVKSTCGGTTTGAKGNFPTFYGTGSVSYSTPTTLVATSPSFSPSNVGQKVILPGGLASGLQLNAVVTGYTDSEHVTLGSPITNPSGVSGAAFAGGIDDTAAIQACATYAISNGMSLYIPTGAYLVTSEIHFPGSSATPPFALGGGFWVTGDEVGQPAPSGNVAPPTTVIVAAFTVANQIFDFDGDTQGKIRNIAFSPLNANAANSADTGAILVSQGTSGNVEGGQFFTVDNVFVQSGNCAGCASIAMPNVDEGAISNTYTLGPVVVGWGIGQATNVASANYTLANVIPPHAGVATNTTRFGFFNDHFQATYAPALQLTGSYDYSLVDVYAGLGGTTGGSYNCNGSGPACLIEISAPSGDTAPNAVHFQEIRTENHSSLTSVVGVMFDSGSVGGYIDGTFCTGSTGSKFGFTGTNRYENLIIGDECGGSNMLYVTGTPTISGSTLNFGGAPSGTGSTLNLATWKYDRINMGNGSAVSAATMLTAMGSGTGSYDTVTQGSTSIAFTDLPFTPATSVLPAATTASNLACAHAADITINSNAITGGSSTASTITFTMASTSGYYPGMWVGTQGTTPSGATFAAAQITSGGVVTNTSVTVSSTLNPGTISAGGTMFAACQNQTNDALSANPVIFNAQPAVPAAVFNTYPTSHVNLQLAEWTPASAPALSMGLFYGTTNLVNNNIGWALANSVSDYTANAKWGISQLSYSSPTSVLSSVLESQSFSTSASNNTTVQPVSVSTSSSNVVDVKAWFAPTGISGVTASSITGCTVSGTSGQALVINAMNDSSTNSSVLVILSATVSGAALSSSNVGSTVLLNTGYGNTAAPTSGTCTVTGVPAGYTAVSSASGTATFTSTRGGAQGTAVLANVVSYLPY